MPHQPAIFKPSPKASQWSISGEIKDLSGRGMIMGIVNTTPDSFSDGGKYNSRKGALIKAIELETHGASIVDFGGESTRPGAIEVSSEEELERVIPAIKDFYKQKKSQTLISIDTFKPKIAKEALNNGAKIINDITGLTNPEMREVAALSDCGIVLMHMSGKPNNMQDNPHYSNVTDAIIEFFENQLVACDKAGIRRERIILDPGIGFGKTAEHNLELLKSLTKFSLFDRPLMIGVSRKSFIAKVLGTNELDSREWPTVALTSYCREFGALVFRVHNSLDNFNAMRMTEAIISAESRNK